MTALEKYLSYIFEGIINDINGFYHWWMFLIIPAIFYFIFLILKYALLTLPIWLPFAIISSFFKK